MGSFSITVNIIGRNYKPTIQREDEELARKAQKLINERVKVYAKNYAYNDKQDLLAMCTLESTIKELKLESQTNYETSDLENKLIEIDKLLTDNT